MTCLNFNHAFSCARKTITFKNKKLFHFNKNKKLFHFNKNKKLFNFNNTNIIFI